MAGMQVTITAAIMAVLNAALAVVAAWGVNLSDDQRGSITLLANALLVLGALVYDKRLKQRKTGP